LVIIAFLLFGDTKSNGNPPTATCGAPVVYKEDLNVDNIRIDGIFEYDSALYLLDQQRGYIRVFDLSGNYVYTLLFYDYLNGVFQMATQDDRLYVQDPHGDLYVFVGGEFTQFMKHAEAKNICQSLNFEQRSENYEIRFGSVWRSSEFGEQCVIKRPVTSMLYQGNISIIVTIVIVLVIGVVRFTKHKKNALHDSYEADCP
jgi:hypothetical protein